MHLVSSVRIRIFMTVLALGLALLIVAACSDDNNAGTPAADVTPQSQETPPSGETPPAGETPTPAAATADIAMVPSIQFDKSELRIAADTDVTVTADNQEQGVSHSFAVYQSEEAASNGDPDLGKTDICAGPCAKTVTLNVAAGEYFFRCEVHLTAMTGTLIAE